MPPDAAPKAKEPRVVGEARWPMAFAVVAVVVLTLLLPHDLVARPRWAAHRLLDTALGCALALASMYLLWPKDKPDVHDAGSAGSAVHAPQAAP